MSFSCKALVKPRALYPSMLNPSILIVHVRSEKKNEPTYDLKVLRLSSFYPLLLFL